MSDDWSSLTEDFMKEVDEGVKETTDRYAEIALRGVNKHSPSPATGKFSTGRFVANNIVSLNLPTFEFNAFDFDVAKTESLRQGLGVIKDSKPYDKIIIQNNAPYAEDVEYSGWARTPAYKPYGLGFNIAEES